MSKFFLKVSTNDLNDNAIITINSVITKTALIEEGTTVEITANLDKYAPFYTKFIMPSMNITVVADLKKIEGGVAPTGTINITENGNYDVTEYATAEVLINGAESSKVVLDYNTASLVTSYNEESNYIVGNTISFTDILNDQNVNINYNTASEILTYNGDF